MAQRIVSTLWELANEGRTVMMTIHQPSSVSSDDSQEDQDVVKQTLVVAFKANIADDLNAGLHETGPDHLLNRLEYKKFGRWTTTWWQQFSVLLRRGVKERKHNSFLGLKIGQVLVVAFLSGLLWWQYLYSTPTRSGKTVSAFYLLCIYL
ncbi:hypothetical protein Acr_11g0017300 [Actinidia rufa]|uniref:Uncharacterized protein n=1 Tax=Actinidia rufa TaxID=165716 RepID=A0A7J0FFF2_9ERIC|nr:hypothetical protein Acr_11g0017300 [Actinidia rufa]